MNNTVYIAKRSNNKVLVWKEGDITPARTLSGELQDPYSVFVTLNGDIYVDNGEYHSRVDMWPFNSSNSTIVMYVTNITFGLFIDHYYNLYCSNRNQVIKRSLNDSLNSTVVIAGTNSSGPDSMRLSTPRGIFVDFNLNLYVADCGNDRIQLFQFGQLNATTVVGNGAAGTPAINCLVGVVLDCDGYLFFTDNYNHRIIGSGPNGFRCIAGCTEINGSAADQLFYPRSLSFDSYGNIYVADGFNHRIQKFLLASNFCGK